MLSKFDLYETNTLQLDAPSKSRTSCVLRCSMSCESSKPDTQQYILTIAEPTLSFFAFLFLFSGNSRFLSTSRLSCHSFTTHLTKPENSSSVSFFPQEFSLSQPPSSESSSPFHPSHQQLPSTLGVVEKSSSASQPSTSLSSDRYSAVPSGMARPQPRYARRTKTPEGAAVAATGSPREIFRLHVNYRILTLETDWRMAMTPAKIRFCQGCIKWLILLLKDLMTFNMRIIMIIVDIDLICHRLRFMRIMQGHQYNGPFL